MAISIIRLTLATGSDHHQIYHRDQVSKFAIIETLKIYSITGPGWDMHNYEFKTR